MTPLWTVTRRELNEWRPVVWITGALLALVWSLPWLPGVPADDPAAVRAMGSLLVAGLFGLGLALLLGANLLGRDLAEGRLGFYLSQPLSAGNIWFGKVLAGLILLVGSIVVLQLPALVESAWLVPFTGHGASLVRNPLPILLGAFVILSLVLLLTHALAVGFRSRSAWLAVDVAGLAATLALLISAHLGYLRYYALDQRLRGAAIWLIVVLLAWLGAGYLQVRRGGGSLRLGHRWLATIGWTLTVVASLGLVAHAQWTQGGSLHEIERWIGAEAPERGSWIAATGIGPRRSLPETHLYNRDSGASVRAGAISIYWNNPVAFDDSGTHAWAFQRDRFTDPYLVGWKLDATATQLSIPLLQLSSEPRLEAADGWLALIDEPKVSLYRTDPLQLVGEITPSPRAWGSGQWRVLPDGRVRNVWISSDPNAVPFLWEFDGQQETRVEFTAGLGPITWHQVPEDLEEIYFIAGDTLYQYQPDVAPEPRALVEQAAALAIRPGFRHDARLGVVTLDGAPVVATRGDGSTLLQALSSEEPTTLTVPGELFWFRRPRATHPAQLATHDGEKLRLFRIDLEAGRLTAQESAVQVERFLWPHSGGVFVGGSDVAMVNRETGELESVLPRP